MGAFTIGLSTAYLIWYAGADLAINFSTIVAGELLGIVYGAFLFPFYIKPIKKEEITH
ncbi:hypothetical protein [Marivirga sericea]|uniref:hypothetical protein n=1 Tax=Marivirga sericea TaxID=1028 RepID=UPI00159458FB|nr:hypothetical protein [Marivirga sericea]